MLWFKVSSDQHIFQENFDFEKSLYLYWLLLLLLVSKPTDF